MDGLNQFEQLCGVWRWRACHINLGESSRKHNLTKRDLVFLVGPEISDLD
jgi:hypothetical protein